MATIPKDLWPTIASFADERTLLCMREVSRALHAVCTRQLRRDPRVRRWLDLRQFLNSDDPRPTKRLPLDNNEAAVYVGDMWIIQGLESSILQLGEGGPEYYYPEADGHIYRAGDRCAVVGETRVLNPYTGNFEDSVHYDTAVVITGFRGDLSKCRENAHSLAGDKFTSTEDQVYKGKTRVCDGRVLGGSAHGAWIANSSGVCLYEDKLWPIVGGKAPSAISPYLIVEDGYFYDRRGRRSVRRTYTGYIATFDVNLENDWVLFNVCEEGEEFAVAIRYSQE